MPQSTYLSAPAAGRAGLIADLNDVLTETVVSDAVAYFGRLLSQDSSGEKFHPAAAADITTKGKVSGVVVAAFQEPNLTDGDSPSHPVDTPFSVLRKGKIWVALDQNVALTDSVYVRFSENAGVDEVQTLTPTAAPASGEIVLSYDGETTDAIAYDATAGEITTALEALTTIGAGNIVCTGTFATAVVATFGGDFEATPMEAIAVESCTFKDSGEGDVTVAVAETTPGEETQEDTVGMFRADDDDPGSGDAKAALLSGARYVTAGVSGGTAIVDLDL